ncbi:MAG TPA: flagellar biosynthetic protein FliP [Gammaproteobacteria bacterium]|jgi:flagellar biosynthetic protein FliP|nr:flagellar biosynthetic protein FliP [Gammaproteobacteria bacterium]
MKRFTKIIRFSWIVLLLIPLDLWAAPGIPAVSVEPGPNGDTYSLSIQALVLMTALTLLPTLLLTMTSFTRIIVVLAILRTALGTQQTPSTQILIGLALFLTLFIMQPVFGKIYDDAISPYLAEEISVTDALKNAEVPVKDFMLKQTREDDLSMFLNLSGKGEIASPKDVSLFVILPSFITSELKTAFQIGFLLFIPFLIVDLVVASVLMSMGMMMLSPMIISMPFKLMLFVLVDGWALVLGTLAGSFYQ